MKRIFLIILCIILSFTGCSTTKSNNKNESSLVNSSQQYIKSVWLCYFELSQLIKNNDENQFKSIITNKILELKEMGFNTLTVQIKPCCDAFYMSKYFPSSKYCFGNEGAKMPYDPFKIICDIGSSLNVNIEAWMNPYRVSQNNDINNLCDDSIAKKWFYDENKKHNIYISEKGIYFNPASSDVIELIVNGVNEVVQNYNIYAIHFDDYFYPTTDTNIDDIEYNQYQEKGGSLDLFDWRRENVSTMVKKVYKVIKNTNSDVLFGISPSANIDNNYNNLYADVKLWASENGFIDYICPQVYYGFLNEKQPFMNVVKQWVKITNKPLYIGLPLYKCSVCDKYASKTDNLAQNEFIDNNNIIARQINYISKISDISGFYLFSYNSLFDDDKQIEVNNLLESMQYNNHF